jgi:hypothetical protein
MPCPFLGRTQPPQCRAVSGRPGAPSRAVLRALCRGDHARCHAFRFLAASGRPVHPADFRAWVVRGVAPGRAPPDGGPQEPEIEPNPKKGEGLPDAGDHKRTSL